MSYEHYIRIDDQNRVVDGFSTFDRQPQEGNILLRSDGGEVFDILGEGLWRPLFFVPPAFPELKVYEYAWTGTEVRRRDDEEILSDIPPLPNVPDTGTRLDSAEADIQTLLECINIIVGG